MMGCRGLHRIVIKHCIDVGGELLDGGVQMEEESPCHLRHLVTSLSAAKARNFDGNS
jgi:hypothetical protein